MFGCIVKIIRVHESAETCFDDSTEPSRFWRPGHTNMSVVIFVYDTVKECLFCDCVVIKVIKFHIKWHIISRPRTKL